MCETVNGLKNSDLNYYFKYIAPSMESDDFDVVTIDVSFNLNRQGSTDPGRDEYLREQCWDISSQNAVFSMAKIQIKSRMPCH